MKDNRSPAVKLYEMAMYNSGFQMGRSNMRHNHAKQHIIEFCVKFGVQFFEDDFDTLPCLDEGFYAIACGCDREYHNMSACLAMEKAWGRKPFLVREMRNKTPDRMYSGRWFEWILEGKILLLKCTSFNDEKKYFNACQYKNNKCHNYGEKPIKQFKITHKDIKEFHALLDPMKTEPEEVQP
jgi:hypothetical protein